MSNIARLAALTCIAASCAASVCLSTNARADAVYDYTGAIMTGTEMGDIFYPTVTYIDLPIEMTLDGSMTFSAPLAPNLVDAYLIPIAMTFNLGAQTPLGEGASPGGVQYDIYPSYEPAQYLGTNDAPPTSTLHSSVEVSTDSTGAITGWSLSLISPYDIGIFANATVTSAGDTEDVYPQGAHEVFYTASNTVAGTWTEEAQAPEIDPASATSALTLLAGFLAIVRGRRRSHAHEHA